MSSTGIKFAKKLQRLPEVLFQSAIPRCGRVEVLLAPWRDRFRKNDDGGGSRSDGISVAGGRNVVALLEMLRPC